MEQEISSSLFRLHKDIFIHAMQNATGTIRLPLFSIQAPGHIGVDDLEIPNCNFTPGSLPADMKQQVVEIFEKTAIGQRYPAEGDPFSPGILDAFLSSMRQLHIASVVSNPLNHYQAFLINAEEHSLRIASWLQTGTTSRHLEVHLQQRLKMHQFPSIGEWNFHAFSLSELCLEGYEGHQSGQEAAERVFNTCCFRRDMASMPASLEGILTEIDILSLSLWQGLGKIFRTQDVRLKKEPWNFSPDVDRTLGIRFEVLWENPRELMAMQNFTRFNQNRQLSVFEPVTEYFFNRIMRWFVFLNSKREAVFSVNMLCDGHRDIARSVSEQTFRKSKIARDGIYKTLSGLEGLNSECKPVHHKHGYKLKSTETFIDCWGKIWEKAVPGSEFLCRCNDIPAALRSIYDLRSLLAHSDPATLDFALQSTKIACGDIFSPGLYDATSVGVSLLMIIDELLEYLSLHPDLFRDMLSGVKPS